MSIPNAVHDLHISHLFFVSNGLLPNNISNEPSQLDTMGQSHTSHLANAHESSSEAESPIFTGRLPTDILLQIIGLLEYEQVKATLSALARTSKYMHQLITPLLWKHLTLKPSVDDNSDNKALSPSPSSPGSGKASPSQIPFIFRSKKLLPDHQRRFDLVNTLEINKHNIEWCQTGSLRWTPSFPNLRTLRIESSQLCTTATKDDTKRSSCRLISGITQLDFLIVRGSIDMDKVCIPRTLWKLPREILVVSSYHQIYKRFLPPAEYKGDLPRLERITYLTPEKADHAENILESPHFVLNVSRILIEYEFVKVCYVGNFRYKTEGGEKVDHAQAVKEFEDRLKRMMVPNYWTTYMLVKRQQRLEFISLDKWIEDEQRWKGKLTEKEVDGWRRPVSKRTAGKRASIFGLLLSGSTYGSWCPGRRPSILNAGGFWACGSRYNTCL
ncbi:uncharacterized protein I303_102016 [Kwoniella dejecticola CBS 10117]|uniref:F-box domain-containing protein n=1 Tax=Kwoniella dejecticola CBS 10117 TaxID=1296121 RepID=A0A1A6AC70_9TREE|nr:uncharacterized protein I303_01846 [Kwoniella dejecticola CBS 10117]OBR87638.1 hypothetical protein I303_01846 [Kwoniella dejecticola CBS 10117]